MTAREFNPARLEVGRLYSRMDLYPMRGYDGIQAISRGVVTPSGSDHIILFVTRQKQKSFTPYEDFLSGDRLHWEGEKRHGSDLPSDRLGIDLTAKLRRLSGEHLPYLEYHRSEVFMRYLQAGWHQGAIASP